MQTGIGITRGGGWLVVIVPSENGDGKQFILWEGIEDIFKQKEYLSESFLKDYLGPRRDSREKAEKFLQESVLPCVQRRFGATARLGMYGAENGALTVHPLIM